MILLGILLLSFVVLAFRRCGHLIHVLVLMHGWSLMIALGSTEGTTLERCSVPAGRARNTARVGATFALGASSALVHETG